MPRKIIQFWIQRSPSIDLRIIEPSPIVVFFQLRPIGELILLKLLAVVFEYILGS